MPDTRYLVGGSDGWLRVKREPSGAIISLPEFLRVDMTSNSAGRDHFTVLEGIEQGNKFSVLAGNLKNGNAGHKSAASLQFSLSREMLTYAGGKVRAITHGDNPIPIGQHPIQIPDFPHEAGFGYVGHSVYAKTWFYLGVGVAVYGRNDRYLHTGMRSAGCITVDPSGWTALYRHLILSRSGNGKTVGTVTVVR
jgi:hypothetical protein